MIGRHILPVETQPCAVTPLSWQPDYTSGGMIPAKQVGDMIIIFPEPEEHAEEQAQEEISLAPPPAENKPQAKMKLVTLDDDETLIFDLRPGKDEERSEGAWIEIRVEDEPPSPTDAAIPQPKKRRCFTITKAALIPALLAAGVEVADVMTSLIGVKRSFIIVIPASITAFLASFGLTGSPTELAFEEICAMIRTRDFPKDKPEEWPHLSYSKELIALILASTLACWGIFSKFTQAYYLMNTVPGDYSMADTFIWKLISSVFAGGYAVTGLMTESLDAYKFIRKWLAREKAVYPSLLGKIFALGIGSPFAVINACMDSTQAITTILATYAIFGPPGFWMMVIPAILLDGGQKLAFEGRTVVNAIYDLVTFLHKLVHGKEKIERHSAVAFSLSLAMAVFLEYSKQALNYSFYKNEAGDFNLDANNPAMNTFLLYLSWLTFVGGILIDTPSLFPEIKIGVTWTEDKIIALKNKIASCLSPWFTKNNEQEPLLRPEATEQNINNNNDARPYRDYSRYMTFSHFKEIKARLEEKQQSPCCNLL
jgi:hypothetical protein